jgi:beta-lactamase class A
VKRLAGGLPALAAQAHAARLSAGVVTLQNGQAWCSDSDARFPLESAFILPMVAAALAEVDAGRLALSERIHLADVDLSPPPSAIGAAWPSPPDHHDMDLPAIDLIALAVQRNDNTAADVIMRRIGGPGAVTAWLHDKGIEDMRVDRYARDYLQDMAGISPFHPAWKDEGALIAARDTVPPANRQAAMEAYIADPRDTTTVPAALRLLQKLGLGSLLSPASTRLLITLMTSRGAGDGGAFLAGVPRGSIVAEESARAPTDLGYTPAASEMALVTLPGGRRLALAAFVAGATSTESERRSLFAGAARLMTGAFN